MTQLSDHFTLEELTFSSTASAHGIDNSPGPEQREHLFSLACGLETVRAMLGGRSLHIDSGYRCPSLNQLVRGVPSSAHVTGYAADFICPEFGSPLDIVRVLSNQKALAFDQLIQEGTWVHISFEPKVRREVLTAHFVNGRASYLPGVMA